MSHSTFPCIYPFVDTSYPPYSSEEGVSCGLSCVDPRLYYLFFTRAEEERLENILFVMSLITICLVPIYFIIVLARNIRASMSFCNLPFSYQCPVFVSCGHVLLAFITMTPFLFGSTSIICSNDQTMTWSSLHNVKCTLSAIGMYISIRIAAYYTCTLSISLVITLYYPKAHQVKRWCHYSVWFFIALSIIPLALTNSACGDLYMGFCTPCLTSRSHLLLQTIIPLATCLLIFCVCFTIAMVKLWRQNKLSRLLSVSNHMHSLFLRVLQYNLLQTTAWAAVVSNHCYVYANVESWEKTSRVTLICQVQRTLAGLMSAVDYEMCVREYSDLPRPSLLTYWITPLCGLISVLSGIIFECSLKEQRRSISSVKGAVLVLTKKVSLTNPRNDLATGSSSMDMEMFTQITITERDEVFEQIQFEGMEGERDLSLTETAVLEDLESTFRQSSVSG